MVDRWATIDRIFAEALEHPTAEQLRFVSRASAGDDEVAGEVLALLQSHEEARLILGESAAAYAEPLLEGVAAEWAEEAPGERRVGPYRLLREIGRGGTGTVFLAQADDRPPRQVALRLVDRRRGTRQEPLRSRDERPALTALEHPNIARLYDRGVADDGLPYLVTEYVEGRPITAYCEEERLGLEERLTLFRTVGHAVQFAHQHLVVHRDLKPSNILVTADGAPKLLDFGLAGLLGSDAPLDSPEYAAPEQIRGGAITTATDVYALGILLYELLAGARPNRLESSARLEAEPAAPEQEPVRPSAAATTPARWRRRLRGDLDGIVLKALETDPGRRYQAVQELLDDVDRHLAGLPVRARRPAWRLPSGSDLRRRRIATATAAAFIVAVAGLSLLYNLRVTRERDRARARAANATATAQFVANLFEGAAPDPGDTVDLAHLAGGARRFSPAEVSRPEMLGTLQSRLGRHYLELGDYSRAIALLDSAVALRRAVYGAEHEAVGRALRDAAEARKLRGDYPGAEPLYRQALAIERRRLGPRRREVGVTLNRLADMLVRSGRPDSAEPLYREALDILSAAPADERREIAIAKFGLGMVKRYQGELAQAEPLFRDVLDLRRQLSGRDRTEAARLADLGILYLETGRYDSAEATLRRSLAIRRTRFGERYRELARGLDDLAFVTLEGRKDYHTADSLWHEALAIREELYGRRHREVGMTLADLGQLELERGNSDSALHLFATGRKVLRAVSGEVSADVARLYRFVGLALYQRGDLAGAQPELERAVELRRAVHGPSHLGLAVAELSLADVLRDRGRYARADSLYAHALAMWREREGDDEGIAAGLTGYGRLRLRQGRAAEADSMLREALAVARKHHPDTDERVAQVRTDLGAALLAQGRAEEAESLLVGRRSADTLAR